MLQIQSIEAKDPTGPVVLEEDLEAVTEVVLEEAVEVEAAEVEVLVPVEDLDPVVDSEVELEVVVSCQASYPDLNKKAVVVAMEVVEHPVEVLEEQVVMEVVSEEALDLEVAVD